jgi:hypothetical protein
VFSVDSSYYKKGVNFVDQNGLDFDEILAGGELTRTNPKRY